MTFLALDTVVYGEPGDLVFKPRHVWHSFWNATDEPARPLEIISPAGFEQFFAEASARGPSAQPDEEEHLSLLARYGLQINPDSVSRLVQTHDLVIE